MDAATELTRTYLQRVRRGWAGKGTAAKPSANAPCSVPHSLQITRIQNRRVIRAGRQCRRSEQVMAANKI
ncbi:hypothetical protein DB811_17795 [Xanthomonas perforans]|uniref:Uncharacterized protein n=1 Tax=Xanthomonas perforans TaxID=442694 RepID=A0AAQ0YQM0_XANPE|nr:hypothetical protein Xcom_06130 [Xanthomonas axonopodis pv. commiphoreae]PPU88553.1 hypothetical protein XaclCFBP3371_09790 [Xanthomonas euvesicatoria pv. citrumelonis]PWH22893.1 hypothetical protein CEX93_20690 [Xanthomonas euvesicatoria]RXD39390.1 hypothetical protein DB854_00455 [Xanthomonas perforans]RXD44601.1 hypothetical protein DB757_03080 [Xanthomonas perforans]